MQSPMIGPRLPMAARDLENQTEDLFTYLIGGCVARSDSACVNIDQIGPLFGQRGS